MMKKLRRKPKSHWLLTRLSSTYYEERKYSKALALCKRAVKLAPVCPLALWDYACTLDMTGNCKKAIAIWKKLLRRGADAVAYNECGEGLRWARSLLNDCKYRIGIAYRKMGNRRLATSFLRKHCEGRSPSIPSIYKLSLVKRELKN